MSRRTIGVAIAIPEPFGSELQRWREHFGDPMAHAIPTHVTLSPPITVRDGELEKIDQHLREAAAAEGPFPMRLGGSATFRPVSPVVFVQVASGISDCERLELRIRSGPLDRPVRFPYHPHVTIAHDLPEDVLDQAFDALAGYTADFTVGGFCLYEHEDGVWRPRSEYPLDASRDD
jgi:2'-5' RNA ligase